MQLKVLRKKYYHQTSGVMLPEQIESDTLCLKILRVYYYIV